MTGRDGITAHAPAARPAARRDGPLRRGPRRTEPTLSDGVGRRAIRPADPRRHPGDPRGPRRARRRRPARPPVDIDRAVSRAPRVEPRRSSPRRRTRGRIVGVRRAVDTGRGATSPTCSCCRTGSAGDRPAAARRRSSTTRGRGRRLRRTIRGRCRSTSGRDDAAVAEPLPGGRPGGLPCRRRELACDRAAPAERWPSSSAAGRGVDGPADHAFWARWPRPTRSSSSSGDEVVGRAVTRASQAARHGPVDRPCCVAPGAEPVGPVLAAAFAGRPGRPIAGVPPGTEPRAPAAARARLPDRRTATRSWRATRTLDRPGQAAPEPGML